VKLWRPEGRRQNGQSITLAFMPSKDAASRVTLADAIKDVKRQFGDDSILKATIAPACKGTQKVIFIENRAAIAGFSNVVAQVEAPTARGTYLLTYGRPSGQPEGSTALQSLFSLCTKG
jgi:hypothetical protein